MKKTVWILLLVVLVAVCALLVGLKGCSPEREPIVLPKKQSIESDLIVNLVEYLDSLDAEYMMVSTSIGIKINQIREDSVFKRQPVHVEIDPSSYYFMCGYYNCTHQDETRAYTCAEKYNWVRFENADEIQEYYNGEKMIVAFQINESLFVKDVLTGDVNVVGFTNFQPFDTQFTDGFNTNAPVVYDKTLVFLYNKQFIPRKQLDEAHIYYFAEDWRSEWDMFYCIRREGVYYVLIELYSISSNGYRYENDLTREFREYYDTLIDMIQKDEEYSVDKKGYTQYYGLIPMNDFVNAVLK